MKKIILLGLAMFLMVGCSPSEEQILAALAETQTAQPTNASEPTDTPEPTHTPEPTLTATITNTPTPDFTYFKNLSHDDAEAMFLSIGVICVDQALKIDGSYEQECNWFLTDCLIAGKIFGQSPETVSQLVISYLPYTGEDLDEEITETFLDFVSFGDDIVEKRDWVQRNLERNLDEEESEEVTKYFDDAVLVINASKIFSILAVSARN